MSPGLSSLRNFSLFLGLSDDELSSILDLAISRTVKKGSCVFEQGAPASHFYFLKSGRIKVTQVTEDGQQIIVRVVHPGDMFGFAKALARKDYPGTSRCVTDSCVLSWPTAMWHSMIHQCPALAATALTTVGKRLEEAHTRIREMSTEEAEKRIAHTLLRLCEQAGCKVKGGVRIDFPISRQDLAELTGCTIYYVSRLVSGWEARGIIEGGRQSITVKDVEQLRAVGQQ